MPFSTNIGGFWNLKKIAATPKYWNLKLACFFKIQPVNYSPFSCQKWVKGGRGEGGDRGRGLFINYSASFFVLLLMTKRPRVRPTTAFPREEKKRKWKIVTASDVWMCMQLYCPLAPWQGRKKKRSNRDCFVCFLVSMWSPKMRSVCIPRKQAPISQTWWQNEKKKPFGVSHTSLLRCECFGNLMQISLPEQHPPGFADVVLGETCVT